MTGFDSKRQAAMDKLVEIQEELGMYDDQKPEPRLDQGPDYERGFVDGMMYQTQSSVDKAVNRMTQPEQEPMFNWLPKHKCGLHLNHNEHRNYYQTVEECYDPEDFVSEDEWLKAIKEDSVWVLQWYPNTPIGFARVAASTLEAIQQWLKEGNT